MFRDDDVLGLAAPGRSRGVREIFDDVGSLEGALRDAQGAEIVGDEVVGEGIPAEFAHAFGGPWGQWRGMPTTQPWGGPEPMRGYGYPSYVNPQDVQEEPDFDESFDETILRHTRASRGG